jgi:hypothetical protein
MRRVSLLALVILLLASAGAGAQQVRIGRERFTLDPENPAMFRFAVEILEPGSYEASLTVKGEAARQIELLLLLRPEAGGEARTVQFSFTGRGCG